MALNQMDQTEVSRLYVAIFNRASEGEGNKFWQELNKSEEDTANEMLELDISKEYFGDAINEDQAFIEHIYLNTLGKTVEDDEAGISFWVEELSAGKSRGFVVAELVKAAADPVHAQSDDQKTVDAHNQFINRVDVSNYAAETMDKAPEDFAESMRFVDTPDEKGLFVDHTSVASHDAELDINALASGAIELTENPDTVSGNIINANRVWNPAGTDQLNSLNDDDDITGTGENPTLNVTMINDTESGDLSIMPEMAGIETVNVNFTADTDQELDLQDTTGIKHLNASRIDNNVNIIFDNIQETLTSATVANSNDNLNSNVIFDHRTAAVSGDADELALKLDDVQMGMLIIDDNVNDGYETINLESTGDANIVQQFEAEDLQTLNITGDKNLTISATAREAGSLNLVDASGLEASLDFTLEQGVLDAIPDGLSNGDIAFTLNGTKQDDIVRIADTVGATDKIELDEGNDTLVVQAVNPTDNYTEVGTTITGVEAIELLNSDADDAVIGILADEVDGDQSILLRNTTDGAGNVTTYNIANLSKEEANSITLEHSGNKLNNPTASSNALTDNVVNLDVDAGVTEASITIGEGVNTDPRFNFQLYTDSDTSIDPVTGALVTLNVDNTTNTVTSLTINDEDTESNTVELQAKSFDEATMLDQSSAYTDTITIKGGQAGTFMNLDATANLYQYDKSGAAADTLGISDVRDGAAERIVAANFDATEANSNVIARFSDNPADNNFGGQTIEMGIGNDTVIFDKQNDATAGLTISDTVAGGEGHDVLAIDGHNAPAFSGIQAITLGESEWTNVSGMDEIRLVGNASQENDTNGDGVVDMMDQRAISATSPVANIAGYNLTLTDELIESTDAGASILITNDSNNEDNIESSATINARGLSREFHFDYDGEEGAGATADVFQFEDASINGSNTIDGGDENMANVASQNSDVIEVWNSAVVTAGDLENISNVGGISFRSDSTVTETLRLTLTDEVLDAFDSSHVASVLEPETISLISVDEAVAGNVGQKIIEIDVSDVSVDKFNIDLTNLDLANTTVTYIGIDPADEATLFTNGESQAVEEYIGSSADNHNMVIVDGTDQNGANTHDAADNAAEDTHSFTFAEGDYTYTIENLQNGDVIDLPDAPAPTVINGDYTDGEVTLQWASGGQVLTVELTGLAAQDANLNNIADFDTVFGADTII